MHKDLVVKTPSLSGSTELLVIAPIKPGFVSALDAVTYTSRAKLLLRALHAGRKNSHEHNLFRAVSDAVERVGVIHTLRLAVLEPDNANKAGSILLSVNFDGAYESYVRTIWQKAPRLLDLIFCNTVDHVTGWDHSYEAWSRWLVSRQIDTPFYYGTPSLTKGDTTLLRMQDRFQRRQADVDLLTTQSANTSAEQITWDVIEKDKDPQSGPFAQAPSKEGHVGRREGIRQGLQGLARVYRLAELYAPGTPDGELLHHAACELLPEFVHLLTDGLDNTAEDVAGERLRSALQWLAQPRPLPFVRETPPLPLTDPVLPPQAQAGILTAIAGATGACVCLVSFDDAAAAASFLSEFVPTSQGARAKGQVCLNLALTFEGLRACGVSEQVLAQLPLEFRHGMQRRSGVLGDTGVNHPRRWSLPVLNWPAAIQDATYVAPADAQLVPLESVHALLQLRFIGQSEEQIGEELKTRFAKLNKGVRPLSVQWLRRNFKQSGEVIDHFGYADGLSDPVFGPDNAWLFPNQVHLGEALVGHANAADAKPVLGADLAALLQDSSYLVVRKLRQDVEAFNKAVASVPLDPDLVKSKLMGRKPDGQPLITVQNGQNEFNYENDPTGAECPFSAHIRRANPRVPTSTQPDQVQPVPGARPPRIFRRGMAYTDPLPGNAEEKGSFFMAYNASIGEQFEVVQRWLSGGNSSGAPSGAADPICGIPEAGRQRFFRFEHAGKVFHMALDGSDQLSVEPTPLVRLAWGAYFLAPSLVGVQHLQSVAEAAALAATPAATLAATQAAPVSVPWSVTEGVADIKRLLALEASAGLDVALANWKAALEDPESRREFRTASIWAAIRQAHGGLLRTPYGVLVADSALVSEVLTDVNLRYTVDGYQQRLAQTLGPIFLGLDAGAEYDRQATAINKAIEALTFEDGYVKSRALANAALKFWADDAETRARNFGESRWELNLDVREITQKVLEGLLTYWFGLTDSGDFLTPAGFDWAVDSAGRARFPGDFYTPSRHTFQPQPTATVLDIAQRHGRNLRQRMGQFLEAQDSTITATVTMAVLGDPALKKADGSKDYDLAARTIAGAIMGFVPTTDNNLRRIVDQWLRDETIWSLRVRAPANSLATPADGSALLDDAIVRTMMLRPMPEFIWRTAVVEHVLNTADGTGFDVHVGDRVVLGLISATQQGLERGERDVVPVFGGNRSASPAPRHACPGMQSAMGVIAGVLSAIVDTPLALRPATTAGILSFEGRVSVPTRAPQQAMGFADANTQARMSIGKVAITPQDAKSKPNQFPKPALGGNEILKPISSAANQGMLLGWGDSWFKLDINALFVEEWDLPRSLAKLGWDTSGFARFSKRGISLEEMSLVKKREGFYKYVFATLLKGPKPAAILIGGGGNDVHTLSAATGRSPLQEIAAPPGTKPPLNDHAVTTFVHERLRGYLRTLLTNLVEATQGKVPIFVHGYDHPIPDRRGFPLGLKGPWLAPVNAPPYSPEQGIEIMKLLIDALNEMIADLVKKEFANSGVRHLKLTGTLASKYKPDLSDYQDWWLNELHPRERGYDALALVADTAIKAAQLQANP